MATTSVHGSATPAAVATALQVTVIGVLVRVWAVGETDSTVTTVDRGFVGLLLVTPAALGCSYLAGRWARERTPAPSSRPLRALARAVHLTTLVLLVPALLLVLPLVAMTILVEPMG